MVKQPYYVIDFSAASCMFEIRVNDTPLISMNVPSQVATVIPINYAILSSGKQQLKTSILPILGETSVSENAFFKYAIQSFDAANDLKFDTQLNEFEIPKITKEKLVPIVINTTDFETTIPFKLQPIWEQGKNLPKIQGLNKKLSGAYLELADLVSNKHFKILKEKLLVRENNMATSMYLSKRESEARINGIIDDFKNGFDLPDLADDALVVYSSYGKKAALKRPNGEPALSFKNVRKKEQIMLDIEFYLPKNSEEFQVV